MDKSDKALTPQLLRKSVYRGFAIFAKKLVWGKEQVYGLFEGSFKHELSQWCGGHKPITFTAELIRIFNGTENEKISDRQNYDKALKLIRANPTHSQEIDNLVERLTECMNQQIARKKIADIETAGNDLHTELAKLPVSNSGTLVSGDKWLPRSRFPDHIEDIARLLRQAQVSVAIHADAVDYGSFRDFTLHRKLLNAIIEQSNKGITVEFLIWVNREPMSWANKYRDPDARSDHEFTLYLGEFLNALKTTGTSLESSKEYEAVKKCLADKKTDWVNPKGDITKLLRLQKKLEDLELQKLRRANVTVSYSDNNADLSSMGTQEDQRRAPPPFYWIIDRVRGILVRHVFGDDAGAFYIDNPAYWHGELASFNSNFAARQQQAQ